MKKNRYSINFIGCFLCFVLLSFFSLQSNAYPAPSSYFDTVQKTYIGYYQRPADPAGLIYWAGRLDTSGGNLAEIIEAFANSAESQALYGTINSTSIGNVLEEIYQSLLGRPADAGGKDYYVAGFNAGRFTAATIMLNLIDGIGPTGVDRTTFDNKLTAANLFTRTIDPELDGLNFQVTYAGEGDVIAARNFLAFNATSVKVPTQAETTKYIQTDIANAGDGINSTGGTGGGTGGGGSTPGGAFWSSFTVPDPGCITVDTVQVCGPSRVDKIAIVEESTADELGSCLFGNNNAATTGPISPGFQFWCERSQNASGRSTDIKISSMQANLPLIHNYIVRTSDGLPMWETYTKATGGLHGPDGAVYSDPYQKKEFEFAGFKKLTFTTTKDKDLTFFQEHALKPLRDAGYTVNQHSFELTKPGFTAEVGVYDTLDGRVLLEDDVIKKENIWKVRSGDATRGNRGTYDYTPKYKGTAKASMKFPSTSNLVYEISADVTFEKDSALSTETMDVYTASGTITQTNYTVPLPGCSGTPPSFTDDPYPIAKGPYGDLWIKVGSNPIEYVASATLAAEKYPLQSHPYKMCCYSQCSDEVLEPGAQEHMWLMTGLGGAFKTAGTDGRLKGTFQHVTAGTNAGLYEWDFAPAD